MPAVVHQMPAVVHQIKRVKGRRYAVVGYRATLGRLDASGATAAEAKTNLTALVERSCTAPDPFTVRVRGHVAVVFSHLGQYAILTSWADAPDGIKREHCITPGYATAEAAAAAALENVCQTAWDGTVEDGETLATLLDHQCTGGQGAQFRYWFNWQLTARVAAGA